MKIAIPTNCFRIETHITEEDTSIFNNILSIVICVNTSRANIGEMDAILSMIDVPEIFSIAFEQKFAQFYLSHV